MLSNAAVGWFQAGLLVFALAVTYRPLGDYMAHILTSVELRVIDRGPGIPEEFWDLVFRPFQRLGDRDNTTGVGLGLALSRGLAEAMGGTLTPEDTPGGGVTMVLALPAATGVHGPGASAGSGMLTQEEPR